MLQIHVSEILNFDGIGAVVRNCFIKKVLLKISQNSQGNTCARVSFLIKLLFL